MKSKCIDVLIAEHKTILRAVDVLSAIGKEAAESHKLNKEDVRIAAMTSCCSVFDRWSGNISGKPPDRPR
jgi:hypothetical protein